MTRTALSFCALIWLTASVLEAQQYTIRKIVFEGTTPYPQASLEAASGLKPGDTISKTDLQAASQRLIDTGAFDDLQSTLDGPLKSVSVVFKIKPADPSHLLTVGFVNFVWYRHEEIAAEVQKRVPLFNGTVPEAGNLQDAVSTALQQMLAEKGITGKVEEEPVAPSSGQPLRLAEYRVVSPSVRIHAVTLSGVTPPFAAATDKTIGSLTGSSYDEGLTRHSISNLLLAAYKDAGYLASSLSSLSRTIVRSTPSQTEVDVAATVDAGEVYRVSAIDWAGSQLMSAAEFAASSKIHPGDIASQKALVESLAHLEAAYRRKGYMDVVVTAEPKLDAAKHQAAFAVTAIPGSQYTVHTVSPGSLTEAQKKDFERGWRLHPGDPYDETYVASFLKNNTALMSFNGYSASFKTVADTEHHTVDLFLTFSKTGR